MTLNDFRQSGYIIWDMANKTITDNPQANGGDANGRTLKVLVKNAGTFVDLTGFDLNLGWKTSDGVHFGLDAFTAIDATQGLFEIYYTSGMLSNSGMLGAALQLVNAEGILESVAFKITVSPSIIDPLAVQSENTFTALATALVTVNGWNARIDAVEADFIARANNLDATYPIELNSVKQQLADINTDAVKKSATGDITGSGRKNKCKISFISDDGNISDYNVLKPIFQAEDVPCAIGIITSKVGVSNYMSQNQILELQNSLGWEVMSHTVNHLALATLTEQQMEDELFNSKRNLEAMGFDVESIVYPFGSYNKTVKRISRKYYRSGYLFGGGGVNKQPYNTYQIKRMSLGVFFDAPTTDFPITDTFLDYYKPMVDKAVAEDAWLIITTHPAQEFSPGNPTNQFPQIQQDYLLQTIQYIKSLGVDIQNPKDVLNETGNVLDMEGYSKDDSVEKFFRVGGNGLFEYSDEIVNLANDTYSCATPWSQFPQFKITRNIVTSANLTGSPNNISGLLVTDTTTWVNTMMYQTFYERSSDDIKPGKTYTRSSKTNGTWSSWALLGGSSLYLPVADTFNCSNLASAFPDYKITQNVVTSANLANSPNGLAGLLITDKTSFVNILYFQTFKEKSFDSTASGKVYHRVAKTNGTWLPWVEMTQELYNMKSADTFTCNSLISAFPDYKITRNVVTSADLTGSPNNISGILITDKTSFVNILYTQTFVERSSDTVKSGSIYHRTSKADGTWLPWVRLASGVRGSAIPDTSGATLLALETEVNKLKAMLRTFNIIA